ncbi:hypothetical protein [Streptomyces mirabilis]|uniref:hypothetical protein n=1 Tax=Streptomyces mirabilis TaxID=68239 RepID=UPI00324D2BED
MLGLLGFYDELDHRTGRPNGSMRDAVQPVGAQDPVRRGDTGPGTEPAARQLGQAAQAAENVGAASTRAIYN